MDEKTIARFWRKVEKAGPAPAHMPHLGPCWLWTGTTANGYGRHSLVESDVRKRLYAHRTSWSMHFGPISGRLCVLHRCDTPRCVRPDHLFLGTRAENQADMAAKGRSNKGRPHKLQGEASPNAKLTTPGVLAIRAARASGATLNALAREHGVSKKLVLRVVQRKAWKHV